MGKHLFAIGALFLMTFAIHQARDRSTPRHVVFNVVGLAVLYLSYVVEDRFPAASTVLLALSGVLITASLWERGRLRRRGESRR